MAADRSCRWIRISSRIPRIRRRRIIRNSRVASNRTPHNRRSIRASRVISLVNREPIPVKFIPARLANLNIQVNLFTRANQDNRKSPVNPRIPANQDNRKSQVNPCIPANPGNSNILDNRQFQDNLGRLSRYIPDSLLIPVSHCPRIPRSRSRSINSLHNIQASQHSIRRSPLACHSSPLRGRQAPRFQDYRELQEPRMREEQPRRTRRPT